MLRKDQSALTLRAFLSHRAASLACLVVFLAACASLPENCPRTESSSLGEGFEDKVVWAKGRVIWEDPNTLTRNPLKIYHLPP